MRIDRSRRLLLTSSVLAAGLFASSVQAQTAPQAAEGAAVDDAEQTGIGDIIVTARKVE